MAAKGVNQRNQIRNSMQTKTGKVRLGPLNVAQLEKLLTNARKKHVAQIVRRIEVLKNRPAYKVLVVEVIEVVNGD